MKEQRVERGGKEGGREEGGHERKSEERGTEKWRKGGREYKVRAREEGGRREGGGREVSLGPRPRKRMAWYSLPAL